jgi:hypothetical protein
MQALLGSIVYIRLYKQVLDGIRQASTHSDRQAGRQAGRKAGRQKGRQAVKLRY